jgi:hypothetical protein
MSRAAKDLRDENICGSLSNGNTVITCSNLAACYVDTIRMAYVNTICIWAISRSSQIDIVDRNAVAACNVHVEIFAIDRADLVNKSILYFAQLNGLQHGKKSQNHSKFILLRPHV